MPRTLDESNLVANYRTLIHILFLVSLLEVSMKNAGNESPSTSSNCLSLPLDRFKMKYICVCQNKKICPHKKYLSKLQNI